MATRPYAVEERLRTKQKTLMLINQNPRIAGRRNARPLDPKRAVDPRVIM
jgi:hypothetical protein